METEPLKIVVTGDVAIDWLLRRVEAKDLPEENGGERQNWELFQGTKEVPLGGGALLLARLVEAATGEAVLAPRLEELENIPPQDILHSHVQVAKFPPRRIESRRRADRNRQVWRIEEFMGYCGPGQALPRLQVHADDPDADLVILDDAGNLFRQEESLWPQAIKPGKGPLIILKMSRPLQKGKLWQHLLEHHADRLVLIIGANDLRAEEMNISRQVSWDRTALDLIWHLYHNDKCQDLKKVSHLIIRCGLDGALRYHRTPEHERVWLYYDPDRMEGGFQAEVGRGQMMGLGMAFVAAFVKQVVAHSREAGKPLPESLHEVVGVAVRDGILSSRRFLQLGFGRDEENLDYPVAELFASRKEKVSPQEQEKKEKREEIPQISEFNLQFRNYQASEMERWSIVAETTRGQEEYIASCYLEKGSDLDLMPKGQFGKLKTLDRKEIESLNSMKNLIREYLQQESQRRPLSIAVFGPPGAGKSFTVTEVAQEVSSEGLRPLQFNLSQWEDPEALVLALHQVRDVSLRGQMPLVFFDEFDCRFRGEPLGWLKYFLNPMQDGAFRHKELTFHLSKAIFVFAGGTSETFEDFFQEGEDDFRIAKGPDFVSRLRGYINIRSIDPPENPDEKYYLIRRSILLRSLIQKAAPNVFDSQRQRLWIDWGVLQALLRVPSYRHGVRSLQAVLEMSRLSERRKFEAAALPLKEQLKLHVDAETFCSLVSSEVRLGRAIQVERVAQAIHEKYRRDNEGRRSADDDSMQPWENLRQDLKESNRGQARHIETKLKLIDCSFRKVTGPVTLYNFTAEQIEPMARLEHERWNLEKRRQGYVYGPITNKDKKIHECLLAWEELTPNIQEKDRNTVAGIPEFLAALGLEVFELS